VFLRRHFLFTSSDTYFCYRMYRFAAKHSERQKSWQASTADFRYQSRLQFETANKQTLTLTTSISDVYFYSYRAHRTSYAVRSAIAATAELINF